MSIAIFVIFTVLAITTASLIVYCIYRLLRTTQQQNAKHILNRMRLSNATMYSKMCTPLSADINYTEYTQYITSIQDLIKDISAININKLDTSTLTDLNNTIKIVNDFLSKIGGEIKVCSEWCSTTGTATWDATTRACGCNKGYGNPTTNSENNVECQVNSDNNISTETVSNLVTDLQKIQGTISAVRTDRVDGCFIYSASNPVCLKAAWIEAGYSLPVNNDWFDIVKNLNMSKADAIEFAKRTQGGTRKEVYGISTATGYTLEANYAQVMQKLKAVKANYKQLEAAYIAGAEWCSSGFMADGTCAWPRQTYAAGCGGPGIVKWCNVDKFGGITAYGLKPPITHQYIDGMYIYSFNTTTNKWSMYSDSCPTFNFNSTGCINDTWLEAGGKPPADQVWATSVKNNLMTRNNALSTAKAASLQKCDSVPDTQTDIGGMCFERVWKKAGCTTIPEYIDFAKSQTKKSLIDNSVSTVNLSPTSTVHRDLCYGSPTTATEAAACDALPDTTVGIGKPCYQRLWQKAGCTTDVTRWYDNWAVNINKATLASDSAAYVTLAPTSAAHRISCYGY